MKITGDRRRSIGLAGAALWLIVISLVFVVWSFLAIRTPIARLMLIGTVVLMGGLIVISVIVIHAALGLPVSTVPSTPEGKQIRRRFAWVFGAEMFAFAVVNSVVGVTRNFELMPSLNLIIVGVHFFPLAQIFRVPRYNIMGLLFCAIPLVTLLAIPKQFLVGRNLAWYVIPGLGCGLVASLTAVAGLYEAWKYISKTRGAA
jgi:hypothetical protein